MQAVYTDAAQTRASVTLAAGEVALPGVQGPGTYQLTEDATRDLVASGVQPSPYVAPTPPTPQVTSKQFSYALNHLNLRPQWEQAYQGQKQDDRDWFLLGDDPFRVDHKRILRMLGVAGIDSGQVMAQAQTE